MIKTTLSIFGLLVGFLFFMSLTFNNKPIFSYVYEFISPTTKFAQNKAADFLSKSFESTESYSRKIFENSVPKMKDSVKSKLSAQKKMGGAPEEKITNKEKQELDQLIKNN